ncbi:MAG: hypothetical protein JJE39_05425 [Vicinamibacteria bacterium]|nr:hypothetical protein [Vicinamibacteria bacterium]
MAYLLWGFVVACGLFMGGASSIILFRHGFDPLVAANALVYLGCAAYGLPRLVRLTRKQLGA